MLAKQGTWSDMWVRRMPGELVYWFLLPRLPKLFWFQSFFRLTFLNYSKSFSKFPFSLSWTGWFITYNQNPLSDMCYGTKNTPKYFTGKVYQLKRPPERDLQLFFLNMKSLDSLKMILRAQFVILKIVTRGKSGSVAFLSLWICFFFPFHMTYFALRISWWSLLENVRVEVKSKCILSHYAEYQTENFSVFEFSNICYMFSNRLSIFLFG